jgi:RNA polymerase sigma-70 factor (ECF subfamily)
VTCAPPGGTFGDAVDSEHALLERLRGGDEAAFRALVDRHDGALRRVARTFVQSAGAADEVTQETWLAVVTGLDGFEGRSSLRTWIFSILVNQARTRGVRDARNVPFSALEADDRPTVDPTAFSADGRWTSAPPRLDCDPETSLLSAELREHLLDAVGDLPPVQRAVITLRDLVGLPAEDVCELLDVTDGNQRVLLHRARARVRQALVPLVGVSR